ncbi:SDR family NAD(P)-dependent oxidoreductase [Sinosporangium siamense]|uniref:Short-chain dehydrogenase n=1 Tax=Sinosporangium siamense TaxID=1367973 RepID=A0A919VA57_9ACTN|nr:SDR family NAD(P)-dependent oxidoreductase [Sinosporangium siamense]GII95057.1 short-chain dehydrogenase [Sinosporangium siamense]
MDLELQGKTAIVTGGTRGIGKGIVLALARAGVHVATCYRTEGEAVDNLAAELKEIGTPFLLARADVSVEAEVRDFVEACGREFGGSLDLLVHNAGTISHVPFGELTLDEWHSVLNTSLTAAYLLVKLSLPLLSSGSSVVTIGSRVATVGIPQRAHYTAAKSGLIGLNRSLAKELGPRGIRCNVIAPGLIETEAAAKFSPEERKVYEQRYRALISLGKFGRPADIARVVLFLASDLSAYVHGETINVDGGI